MTTGQIDKLNMYRVVSEFLEPRQTILTGLPNFDRIFRSFQSDIAEIQSLSKQHSSHNTSINLSKEEVRLALLQSTGDIARKLHAFAISMNYQILITESRLSKGELENYSDLILLDQAQKIYSRAEHHITHLLPYEIEVAALLEFKNTINNFFDFVPIPTVGSFESTLVETHIANHFRNADESLQYIDALIDIVRIPESDFYIKYRQARRTEFANDLVALTGTVVDTETKTPIKGVTIALVRKDSLDIQPYIVKNTSANGDFYVKSLAEGIYEVILSKGGYKDMIINCTVNKGKRNEINANLARG
ncbi:MAG: carboxypeptidase-like regulatory domain-containing protein [Mariniphaga sp.]